MSVLSFAEELSRLIVRYTKTTSINQEDQDALKPLTYEEIASTMNTVLNALGVKSIDTERLPDNSSADSSSVNTTVVGTLTISGHKEDDCARRLSASGHFNPSNVEFPGLRSSLGVSEGDDGQMKTLNLCDDDESIARSNPAIRVNSIGRSDTFICEKDRKVTINNEDDVFENASNAETNDSLNNSFLETFNEMRKSLLEISTKLDKLEEQAYLQSTKQRQSQRSLSDASRKSTFKTNLPVASSHHHRSASSATPTILKSRAVGKENISDRRKSVSNASIVRAEKSNVAVGRSMSNLNLSTTCDNKLPPPNSMFRLAKNPKYAHVQSTIPKQTRASGKKA